MNIVQLTDAAKDYLNSVRPDDGHITLTVNGGGCAGFTYKWGTTDEVESDEDLEAKWMEVEDILLVDPICEMYIIGSTIDYHKSIEGSMLTIKNPTATSSCGCGESFGV
jgi:iron-sulfur cluster insertion protein|tara:strand:+ start:1157 stop:1483 length:327 start_codon:yes stop_codon:yes gene_type:complete